jgi:hypothetical protein
MAAVTGAISTVGDLVGGVFDIIIENPVLIVFLAAGLVGVGISIFRKLRGAAR